LCDNITIQGETETAEAAVRLEIDAALDFDRLVVLGSGEGSATLQPDGTRQVSGIVEAISARAMVGQARIRGEAGRAVRIQVPRRVELHSLSGARISIERIVTDLPALPRLDAAGNLSFRFGGSIRVSGDVDGDFRGDLPITVEYL
jgi:hypothetical protein